MYNTLCYFNFNLVNSVFELKHEIERYIGIKLSPEQEEMTNLVSILRNYDEATFIHCLEVAVISYNLALTYKEIPRVKTIDLFFAGLIHDSGKIAFNENLFSGNRISNEERITILKHPIIGYTITSQITKNPLILELVLDHHENLKGTGYPNGKIIDKIETKIIIVSDIFSALTMKRNYRTVKQYPPNDAISELKKMNDLIEQKVVTRLEQMLNPQKIAK